VFGRAFGYANRAWWDRILLDGLQGSAHAAGMVAFCSEWQEGGWPGAKKEHSVETTAGMPQAYAEAWKAALPFVRSVEHEKELVLTLESGDSEHEGIEYACHIDHLLHCVIGEQLRTLVVENKTMGQWQWGRGGPAVWRDDLQTIGYKEVAAATVPDCGDCIAAVSFVGTPSQCVLVKVESTGLQSATWREEALASARYWGTQPTTRSLGPACDDYFRKCALWGQCSSGVPVGSLSPPDGFRVKEEDPLKH